MRNRESQSNNHQKKRILIAAVILAVSAMIAAAVAIYCTCGWFTLRDPETGTVYARYPVHDGDSFSIGFIHSVNNSPVTDYFEFQDHRIFVEKIVYYGFGAGVLTEVEEGQQLEYGEDGSMIVSGFHRELPDLVYIVGTISDHTLRINEGEEISLRALCGKGAKVRFTYDPFF